MTPKNSPSHSNHNSHINHKINITPTPNYSTLRTKSQDILPQNPPKISNPPQIPPSYHQFWHPATRLGYSGTAVLTKLPPENYWENFSPAFQASAHPLLSRLADSFGDTMTEGRLQTLEFPDFFLVNVYTPNSKTALERLSFRHQIWDPLFLAYLNFLHTQKPVITCGDFNVAHQAIDLARPQQNTKNAGFTAEERQGIDNLLQNHFLDTFRTLHPTTIQYTWWSHFNQARAKNIGWRIDYFFISTSLRSALHSATILDDFTGSDHCPITLSLTLPAKTPPQIPPNPTPKSPNPLTLLSWNLNGIRAVAKKHRLAPLFDHNPDIICLQETKSTQSQFETAFAPASKPLNLQTSPSTPAPKTPKAIKPSKNPAPNPPKPHPNLPL